MSTPVTESNAPLCARARAKIPVPVHTSRARRPPPSTLHTSSCVPSGQLSSSVAPPNSQRSHSPEPGSYDDYKAYFASLPDVGNVLAVCGIFFMIFAIFAVGHLKRKCGDGECWTLVGKRAELLLCLYCDGLNEHACFRRVRAL